MNIIYEKSRNEIVQHFKNIENKMSFYQQYIQIADQEKIRQYPRRNFKQKTRNKILQHVLIISYIK